MRIEGAGASRGGGDEFHNEDTFLTREEYGLYVVCDGASQLPAGEVASRVATQALEDFIRQMNVDLQVEDFDRESPIVAQGMQHALRAVGDAERSEPGRDKMSTSITMLLAQGHRGVIGQRGDSRAYLIRGRRSRQLTIDLDLTDELTSHERESGFEVFAIALEPGDTVVLCTDGAEEVVEDPALRRVAGDLSPQVLASRIVSAANRRSPSLDATAVVVRVHGEREVALATESEISSTSSRSRVRPRQG